MKITARVQDSEAQYHAILTTNDTTRSIDISPKATGYGSSANRGELLFLALAPYRAKPF